MLIHIVGIYTVLISEKKKKKIIHKTEANGQRRSWNESIHCLSDKLMNIKYILIAMTISLATPLLNCQLAIHDS